MEASRSSGRTELVPPSQRVVNRVGRPVCEPGAARWFQSITLMVSAHCPLPPPPKKKEKEKKDVPSDDPESSARPP